MEVRKLALSLGVECDPVLVADASNLVLRLAPHPIVARVAMATSMVRAGVAWLEREVLIARFLDQRGGAVTRPSRRLDPGPFERGGLVVSFWELETELPHGPDPRRAARELGKLHRELRELSQPVPEWGAFQEMRAVHERMHASPSFTPAERRRVEAAWGRAEEVVASSRARSARFQIVHGDAHIRNVMQTERMQARSARSSKPSARLTTRSSIQTSSPTSGWFATSRSFSGWVSSRNATRRVSGACGSASSACRSSEVRGNVAPR